MANSGMSCCQNLVCDAQLKGAALRERLAIWMYFLNELEIQELGS
jgi:hypothetical protein